MGRIDLAAGVFEPVGDLGSGYSDIAQSDVDDFLYVTTFLSLYTYDLRTSPPQRRLLGTTNFPSTIANPNGLDYFDGKLVVLAGSRAAFAIVNASTGAIIQTYTLPSGMRGAGDIVAKSPTEFWALLKNGPATVLTLITLPGPVETVNFQLPNDVSGFAMAMDRSTGELIIPSVSGAIYTFNPQNETLRTTLPSSQSGLPDLSGMAGTPLKVVGTP